MLVSGSGHPEDIDAPIALAKEADIDSPVRIRIQPTVYIPERQSSGRYVQWKQVVWNVALQNFEEARTFRYLLAEFFTALALVGPTALRVHLASLRASVDDKQGGPVA